MARASDPAHARAGATWIVRLLRDHGHLAYFAGGCVRDGLLGLHPTDYDVATDATPKRIAELFPKSSEVGASFGVVLVHVPREKLGVGADSGRRVSVEVATFRSDGPYSDARRPDTVHFSDPVSDAQRRDFTINALFLDPLSGPAPDGALGETITGADLSGTVIDFVGGITDLRARVLRAVGDPEKRLAEDHLRALRAVRFAARLGFTIDPATAAAIRRHASELKGVSRERIGDELRRILLHPSRARAIELLTDLQLDAPILEEPGSQKPVRLLSNLPQHAGFACALAAWLVDRLTPLNAEPMWPTDIALGQHIPKLRRALCLSNEETDAARGALAIVRALASEWSTLPVAKQKRVASRAGYSDAVTLLRAWSPERADVIERDVHELSMDGIGLGPTPLVSGDDLVAAGWKPGPRFKGVLEAVYDAQLEGKVRSLAEGMELAGRLSV
jgi:poly(A) polymerase